jgi:hypothetical protein
MESLSPATAFPKTIAVYLTGIIIEFGNQTLCDKLAPSFVANLLKNAITPATSPVCF